MKVATKSVANFVKKDKLATEMLKFHPKKSGLLSPLPF
jgi:hypothetical protein